jgi:hypothetical protein
MNRADRLNFLQGTPGYEAIHGHQPRIPELELNPDALVPLAATKLQDLYPDIDPEWLVIACRKHFIKMVNAEIARRRYQLSDLAKPKGFITNGE